MSKEKLEPVLFDKLTLGLVRSLEKRHGICDVHLEQKPPVAKHTLMSWEQKYSCLLPDDVKSFYLTNNGFKLRWSVKMNDTRVPVGSMEVNPLECLGRLSGINSGSAASSGGVSLQDLHTESEEEDDGPDCRRPHFDRRSRMFELDPCDGFSKVCLVYINTKPGIPASKPQVWLLDRSLEWHFLVEDFLSYYRLLLLHLGLPQWQYAFTSLGISPAAKQWFHMYAPLRLDMLANHISSQDEVQTDTSANQLDVNRVFKGKAEKKKLLGAVNAKKKMLPPSNKLATSSLTRTGGTTSLTTKLNK